MAKAIDKASDVPLKESSLLELRARMNNFRFISQVTKELLAVASFQWLVSDCRLEQQVWHCNLKDMCRLSAFVLVS
jgi:hypothetical protein